MKIRPVFALMAATFALTNSVGIQPLRAQEADGDLSTGTVGKVIASNHQIVDVQGEGKTFTVTGGNNQIRIKGDCKGLKVIGEHNEIMLDRVDAVTVLGNKNEIAYKSGVTADKPTVKQLGEANSIVQVGIGKGTAAAASTPAEKEPVQIPANTDDQQVINLSKSDKTEIVTKKKVVLQGSDNNLVLQGDLEELEIIGSQNDVIVNRVQRVKFSGPNNDVIYKEGARPQVTGDPETNDVTQAED